MTLTSAALVMLAAYGLCFALQQGKIPWVTRPLKWLPLFQREVVIGVNEDGDEVAEFQTLFERMLHCTYCTGFHCGWASALGYWGAVGELPLHPESWPAAAVALLVWCFGAAAVCYIVDTAVQRLERA